ncbi:MULTISPECIES: phage tail tape measure protein [unclassified Erwinia]|uniref:phage tail tape measure protein n=1 Tax=unclassified Erwinia TaxID=2622719 RepID=UPI000C1A7E08|nr:MULTISPECIES: phage tail tape measure protein [unclassified Erwinia]PIJ49201.1 phage tail tape measure protein [Erwinia sp. OAMSP11]PIJ79892.1 phage tail tape measure protein [Erwinia sp. OLCASP19]PIJ81060.1 phage tail tape measure protein [Erwinia sp. OLMTSP26]PIJ93116.1 phage tail tape measure protein [Erwinia sp. OLFS4]
MTEISNIVLKANVSDIQSASQELDKFAAKAGSAATAADKMNESQKASGQNMAEMTRSVAETHRRVEEFRKAQESSAQSERKNNQALKEQQQELQILLNRINPTNKAFEELEKITTQLASANQKGLLPTDQFRDYSAILEQTRSQITRTQMSLTAEGRAFLDEEQAIRRNEKARADFLQKLKDQVAAQSLSRTELLKQQAAQLGVGSSADIYIKKLEEASASTHKLGLQSSAARREIGILIGEAARGNFGALRGSGITLANRAGWIDQLMTLRGLGIAGIVGGITAAVYGLGKAWYEGSQESVEFNKQLILTGNYAGKTASQLQEMAKSISGGGITQHDASGIIAQVVGSGSFNSKQLDTVVKAAAAMREATGQSVDETIKNFQKLYADPTKASAELNNQLHYLTSSQYEYIASLERRGFKEAAGQASADALSKAEQERAHATIDNLGSIERALKAASDGWKSFWDSALDVGRTQSDVSKLKTMQDTLAEIEANEKQGLLGRFKNNSMGVDKAALEENIKSLQARVDQQESEAKAAIKAREADESRTKSLQYQNDILSKNQSWQQKRTAALNELWQMVAKAPNDWTEAQRKTAVAQINADNKPPKTARTKSYTTPAGDRAEDATQADLIALQSQLKVLQQHRDINDKISQQRRELWEAQAKYQVLEEASSTRRLSKQEQSLLSSKDQVLANKEQLAVLGDQKVKQQQLNTLMDSAQKFQRQQEAKREEYRSLGEGKSSRQAQRLSDENRIRAEYKDNPRAQALAVSEIRKTNDEQDKLERNWRAGAINGLNEYLETSKNVYSSVSQAAQSALGGVSDMMTNLVTTGTASFKQFSISILKMIVDIINKLLVAYAVQEAMGWVSGGANLSTGGNAGTAISGGNYGNLPLTGHATGGYTGDGGKYEPKGIVHGGEFVFTKEATSSLGIGNLYALMKNATSGRGYADGGYVGKAPMYGLSNANGGSSTAPQVNITINQNGQTQTSASSGFENFGKEIGAFVDQRYRNNLQRDLGQQGAISTFVMGRMGRK